MVSEFSEIDGAGDAIAFITDAYRTRLTRAGRGIDHPLDVAELLIDDRQPPPVVVAGILHDVLEDTSVTAHELEATFGPQTTRLVTALSQDPSIRKYGKRKEALRRQILDAGPEAATVSLADKAAKLQKLKSRPVDRKLNHYRRTLSGIEDRYGPTRLSGLLREQLERFPEV